MFFIDPKTLSSYFFLYRTSLSAVMFHSYSVSKTNEVNCNAMMMPGAKNTDISLNAMDHFEHNCSLYLLVGKWKKLLLDRVKIYKGGGALFSTSCLRLVLMERIIVRRAFVFFDCYHKQMQLMMLMVRTSRLC